MNKRVWINVLAAVALAWVLSDQSSAATADTTLANKMTAYLTPGATPRDAVVSIWMSNVNPVIGITLSFKFGGIDSLILDSAETNKGRATPFYVPQPLYKRENQTLLINMLIMRDSIGAKITPLPPGGGPLATLYFHTRAPFATDAFKMVAMQLPPDNTLMYITETLNTVLPEFTVVRKAPPAATSPAAGISKPVKGKPKSP
ncbi:MAG: hypothetical protein HY234_02335 [Acidobacteria bacterium]|nr:hypothetical protein [Acidobacteriota bacterium]